MAKDSKRIYLDYNATSLPFPEAVSAAFELMSEPLNASSVHKSGRRAKAILNQCRKDIADAVSCFPAEIIFTSSASEANAMALNSYMDRKLIILEAEHPSVLKQRDGGSIKIPIQYNGLLDLEQLEIALQEAGEGGALVSVQLANNETGVIQPISEISRIARKYSAILHSDAVQAFGKIPVDIGVLGVDMMSLSSHKCGAIAGAGALIAREGIIPQALLKGGGQESGRRAGTENIAAIKSFAEAAKIGCSSSSWQKDLRECIDDMEAELEKSGAIIMGKGAKRLPGTSNIIMPDISAEIQLIHFDMAGIEVSAGSACSSGRIEASHVIKAMINEEKEQYSANAIRLSGGWNTKPDEVDAFKSTWLKIIKEIKAI